MDDKAEDLVECLLSDVFDCFIIATSLDLGLTEKFQPKRCVTEDLCYALQSFSDVFLEELMPELLKLPVLLCWSADLFNRFAKSVCLKLIQSGDPELDFLRVMAFLMVLIAMSFLKRCYRWIDEIPKLLETLLKQCIKPKFYEEKGLDDILPRCEKLLEDEAWCKATAEEIRICIRDSFATERAASQSMTRWFDEVFEVRSKTEIKNAGSNETLLKASDQNCPLCASKCFFFIRAFCKPRIIYKPEPEESSEPVAKKPNAPKRSKK